MRTDRYGLQLTAASDVAVAHFDNAVHEFVAFQRQPVAHVKSALEADPDFAMAQCLRGYFYLMLGVPAVLAKAKRCLAAAEQGIATPREHQHFLALQHWCDGDLIGMLGHLERLLVEHPRDMLALRLVQSHYFDLGDRLNLRDSVARVLPAWEPDVPGYGYVLGMRAFGLEECDDYAAAEAVGRQAVDIEPEDIWAVHAVAHVMEMQGRQAEGIAWLEELAPSWTKCNFFIHHLWWHLALFYLELDRHDAALALYDDHVRDDFSAIVLDIMDAAALLWRLELRGVDVGDRWAELAEKCAAHIGDHNNVFSDTHFMMCFAGAGRDGAADDLVASMQAYANTRQTTMAPIMRDVGIAICRALAAFRAGDHGRAVDLLMPARYQIHRIGGSHAQRDLYTQTLISAALASGRFALARSLLAERTALKPASAPSWRSYAEALDGAGDAAAAERARARSLQLN